MTILADSDIISGIYVRIDDFDEEGLTPNGYDLKIAEVHIGETGENVKEGVARVPPRSWFAVSTLEYVTFGPEVAGELWIKTSWARKGVISSFGMIDAGFEGTLTLSAFNGSHKELEVEIGKRFAQMVFHKLTKTPMALYDERSGNYQGQRGVTLERFDKG